MIRTVPIPKTVSRMGCASGGDCCDECRAKTGPPIGPAPDHVHAIPTMRNACLHGHLGDVSCDQDGNCWDTSTGQLTAAPLTTGPGCAPGVLSCSASSSSSISPLVYVVGAGILGMILIDFFTERGR